MISAIIWNIKGSNKPSAKAYLHYLINKFRPEIFVLQEHNSKPFRLEQLAKKLGFSGKYGFIDDNKYIWLFLDNNSIKLLDFSAHEQVVHCQGKEHISGRKFFVSFVYMLWFRHTRQRLWEKLLSKALHNDEAWIIAGDFNIIGRRRREGMQPITGALQISKSSCCESVCRTLGIEIVPIHGRITKAGLKGFGLGLPGC
uniref:Endonuclease/exonuclease/phosphatase domain-containing protein n=1 Tax=Kalanchoe fedtschenkoi TaxID=63787 RepID=A0A7N0ZYT5_KALFE